MRVLLVGDAAERARLRAQINGSMVVVAEFATMAAARAAAIDADAILVSSRVMPSSDAGSGDAFAVEESMTPREIQVLALLAEGLANKALGERMALSDQHEQFDVATIL